MARRKAETAETPSNEQEDRFLSTFTLHFHWKVDESDLNQNIVAKYLSAPGPTRRVLLGTIEHGLGILLL